MATTSMDSSRTLAARTGEPVQNDLSYRKIFWLWGQRDYVESGRLLSQLGLENFVAAHIRQYKPRNQTTGRSDFSARRWATWIYEKAGMFSEAADAMRGPVRLMDGAEKEIQRYESLAAARRT